MLPDPRALPAATRVAIAERARLARDAVAFTGQMTYFNDQPCRYHAPALSASCSACGISLRRHQRTGAAWLWFAMKGLLGDSCGLGKTAQLAAVLAMALQTGELNQGNKAVIVCQASAVRQWARELRRCVPALGIITADGTPEARMAAYLGPWEVCVISDRTLAPAGKGRSARGGDVERLRQFNVGIVVYDDIDAMRNGATKTAWAVKKLAAGADRVYGAHATSLQKRLPELYHFLEPVGGPAVLGSQAQFTRDYVARTSREIWLSVATATMPEKNSWARKKDFASFGALASRASADTAAGIPLASSQARQLMAAVQSHRARFPRVIWTDTGVIERRLPELRAKVAPMVLRRTVADLDDAQLPEVQTDEVWLDLLPAQRERMRELTHGTLRRLLDSGEEITRVKAVAAYTRARQICSGLAALDDNQDVSVKLDWAVDRITGDLAEEKVFCFVYFRENVEALSRRLQAADVGHVLLWSNETNSAERDRRIQRFTNDPGCRVVIATTTAERSLNLQAASHLIAVDTIANPARMTQVLGRVRRLGSRHQMVVFHQLLARDTYEEDLIEQLRREQALADAVWDDTGELFTGEYMSPRQAIEVLARRAA